MLNTESRDGITAVVDAQVPARVPNSSRGKITKKVKKIVMGDGSTGFGCADCTFMAPTFNSVAAHRKVHVVRIKDEFTMHSVPKKVESTIKGTHLEKLIIDEVITVIDKATFADKEEVRRLSRELARANEKLSVERAARRKAERSLKRIKAAI